MSWVTVVWSMIASACLTLALIYFLVWLRNRAGRAQLLFSLTAAATAVFAFSELRIMRAETPAELLTAMKWVQLTLSFWLVSITWFVFFYLGAGRLWLAGTISGMRIACVLLNFLTWRSYPLPSVRRIPFLGESVTVFGGAAVPNPWLTLFGQFSILLLLIFVADAGVSAWRRGDRRKALMVGGSVECFLVAALGLSLLLLWTHTQAPIVYSMLYMGLVAVMGYELSHDVLRASQLVRKLQVSELALHALSARLLTAQEEERRRIARELHDNVSQRVALLAVEIEQIATNAGDPIATARRSIRDLGVRTAEIATEIHTLSHKLHSAKLETLGLVAAVRAHCREVFAQDLEVHFEDRNVTGALPYELGLCLFRIAQEGLSNVVKHSSAREARLLLIGTADALTLSIVDTGRGFDEAAVAETGGLGLVSMRERLRQVGGELTVTSMKGHGTTVVARVPLVHDRQVVAASTVRVA